jgi:hypothetical protein
MLITAIGIAKVRTVIVSCAFSNDVLYCPLKVHAVWLPFEARDNITVSAVVDIVLLIIMLWGLLRSHQTQYGTIRHLYHQVGRAMLLPPVMTVLKL